METTLQPEALLVVAEAAARDASIELRKYAEAGFSVGTKSSSLDRVTTADIESEKIIVRRIRSRFPDHDFLGEEGSYGNNGSRYTWVIDPIDGTNNFIKLIPHCGISIAVRRDDTTVAGVVCDPFKDELFKAALGCGAFLNDVPIRVGSTDQLRDALFATGFYYNRGEDTVKTLETMKNFFRENVLDIRRFGSAALDLCYVACGRVEGYWEHRLSPWDFAAGALICEEAGGRVTTWTGGILPLDKTSIVASNGILHDEMLRIINLPGTWLWDDARQ